MELISGYMMDDTYRHMLNELTRNTFGNLNALGFYQKMGFKVENQYRYYVKDECCHSDKSKDGFKPIKDLENRKCRLGFTPHESDKKICISEVYDGGDDYRLFYRGKELEAIEQDRFYFPDLSHA